MTTPRQIRRLAFQALFQFDARSVNEPDMVRDSLDPDAVFSSNELDRAMTIARAAFENRGVADAAVRQLAPTWPAHRQPAVDRAILRLAHYEMTVAGANPKVVVNDAVELAKEFSTDRSPAFVNGVLDKILKQVMRVTDGAPTDGDAGAPPVG